MPNDNFCLACFNGKYPIPIPPHVRVSKFAFELPIADDDNIDGIDDGRPGG